MPKILLWGEGRGKRAKWLSTSADKPPDTRSEIVGIGLKKVVFMLEVKNSVLLFPLLNVEAEKVSMMSCRKYKSVYCCRFFILRTKHVVLDS